MSDLIAMLVLIEGEMFERGKKAKMTRFQRSESSRNEEIDGVDYLHRSNVFGREKSNRKNDLGDRKRSEAPKTTIVIIFIDKKCSTRRNLPGQVYNGIQIVAK